MVNFGRFLNNKKTLKVIAIIAASGLVIFLTIRFWEIVLATVVIGGILFLVIKRKWKNIFNFCIINFNIINMATNQEQEQYLNDLLADFEESNKLLKSKWDGFMTLFTNNKQNWSDTQYYYFEKG